MSLCLKRRDVEENRNKKHKERKRAGNGEAWPRKLALSSGWRGQMVPSPSLSLFSSISLSGSPPPPKQAETTENTIASSATRVAANTYKPGRVETEGFESGRLADARILN